MKPDTTTNNTLYTVAKIAGVSMATAARALGGYGSVSEKTKLRVKEAAESLNYVPNAVAKSMREQKTKTIGIVVGDIHSTFFSKLTYFIEEEAYKNGYDVFICNTNELAEKERLHLRSLFSKRVDGIIISSAPGANGEIDEQRKNFYEGNIPIVQVDRGIRGVNCPLTQSNNEEGGYKIASYLLGLGHRKIGILSANQGLNTMHERLRGIYRAFDEFGIAIDLDMVEHCEKTYLQEERRLSFMRLYSRHPEMTAMITNNHPLGQTAWLEFKKRGVRVPEDISFVTWGDSDFAEALGITAMSHPIQDIAVSTFNLLLESIKNRESTKGAVLTLDTDLIVRDSCRSVILN